MIHKYERLEKVKDSEGRTQKKWKKYSDTVSKNEEWAQGFGLKDDTGFIEVNPNKSKFDTQQLHSKFEKGEQPTGVKIKLGGLSIGLGSVSATSKTIGFEYKEVGIKMNQNLYLLGDANDRDGSLIVSKPQDKKMPFIVSIKSEDELQHELGSSIKGLKIGAFACFGIGGATIIAGLLKVLGVF